MAERGVSTTEAWDVFFSDFYLRAYAGDERDAEAGSQALAAVKLAGVPEGGEVLDAPCGFGRHSIPLARAGYRVTGVDRSGTLLAEADRRAEGGPSPAFVRADYRELPFDAGRFDGALNLFTSLGYLGDDEDTKVLAEIRRVLRDGARLVIEMMHRDRMVCGGPERSWSLMGEGRLMLEHHTFDPATGIAQTTQTLIEKDGRRESHPFSVRVYTATELIRMVEHAGFAEWRCYGGFDMQPLSTTTRLVVVGIV